MFDASIEEVHIGSVKGSYHSECKMPLSLRLFHMAVFVVFFCLFSLARFFFFFCYYLLKERRHVNVNYHICCEDLTRRQQFHMNQKYPPPLPQKKKESEMD